MLCKVCLCDTKTDKDRYSHNFSILEYEFCGSQEGSARSVHRMHARVVVVCVLFEGLVVIGDGDVDVNELMFHVVISHVQL